MYAAAKGDTKEMEGFVKVNSLIHTHYHDTLLILTIFSLDFDECAALTAECGPGAECINLNGSFRCQCREGFEKIGNNCTGQTNFILQLYIN